MARGGVRTTAARPARARVVALLLLVLAAALCSKAPGASAASPGVPTGAPVVAAHVSAAAPDSAVSADDGTRCAKKSPSTEAQAAPQPADAAAARRRPTGRAAPVPGPAARGRARGPRSTRAYAHPPLHLADIDHSHRSASASSPCAAHGRPAPGRGLAARPALRLPAVGASPCPRTPRLAGTGPSSRSPAPSWYSLGLGAVSLTTGGDGLSRRPLVIQRVAVTVRGRREDAGRGAPRRRGSARPRTRGRAGRPGRVRRLPVPVLREVRPGRPAEADEVRRGRHAARRMAGLPDLRQGVGGGGAGGPGRRAAGPVLGVPPRRLRRGPQAEQRRVRHRLVRHGPRGGRARPRPLPRGPRRREGARSRRPGRGGGPRARRPEHARLHRQWPARAGCAAVRRLRGGHRARRRDREGGGR